VGSYVQPPFGYEVSGGCKKKEGEQDPPPPCRPPSSHMIVVGSDGTKLPPKATLVLTAGYMKVTIILRPEPKPDAYDTQITIKDQGREQRDFAIDAAVEEKFKEREGQLKERENQLEQRAAVRADELVLEGLAQGLDKRGVGGDERDASDDGVVLIGRSALRIGDRRYFVIAIDNQSKRRFEIKTVKLFEGSGKDARPVKTIWRFAGTVIQQDQVLQGAVLIPVKKGGGTFRIRVEDAENDRAVELGGLRAP
jgi:hypothetical protein